MNLPYFIASRIAGNKAATFSRFITRLSVLATALSIAIMIIAVAVVTGFKESVQQKLFVFWGDFHIALSNPNPSSVIAPEPIKYDGRLVQEMKKVKAVRGVYPFAVKPAIISSDGIIEGIKLKGVGRSYPFVSNEGIRYNGHPIQFNDSGYAMQVILSANTLKNIKKHVGDSILLYFVDAEQGVPRVRKLQVAGSFETGVDEIDQSFALCDINLIRRVSNWDANAINGYQVSIDNYKQADSIARYVYHQYVQPPMTYNTLADIYPDIYSWLGLIDINAQVIIIIMSIVAIINMTTALLIFILERTNMIGVLKAQGMQNGKLWLIFLNYAARVAIKGILIGAAVGIGFCALQYYTHIIHLNESTYYIAYVPVKMVAWHVLLIVAGSILLCILTLMIPALLVRRINIVRALRFK